MYILCVFPRVYTGLNCSICSVFHTFTQGSVGHFPFAFIYKLLHMNSALLPYCFLCFLGVFITFLCNLKITNSRWSETDLNVLAAFKFIYDVHTGHFYPIYFVLCNLLPIFQEYGRAKKQVISAPVQMALLLNGSIGVEIAPWWTRNQTAVCACAVETTLHGQMRSIVRWSCHTSVNIVSRIIVWI